VIHEFPSELALALIANIHNEPVRAKVVARPADTSWSSHRAYLGVEPAPRWLHVAEGLRLAQFAGSSDEFDALVSSLGSSSLVRTQARIPAPKAMSVSSDLVLAAVAERYHLPIGALSQRYARGPIAKARQAAVHVARALGG
jgi:hypothetical protein